VLAVDPQAGWVEAEGMVTYEALTAACLKQGVMPAVVPQLKTITLGGALAGVGIESSSHRFGLVHDTVLELDVLLGDGRVVTCTRDNEHADLFFGFPNSYGTLGYALRVKAKAVPVRPYVHLAHLDYFDGRLYFQELEKRLRAPGADFFDGTVFAPDKMFITEAHFVDKAPYTSDYSFERIYYQSIARKRDDYLKIADYIWRWDTDWFWCSKNVLAQNRFMRRFVYGRKRLGSRQYTKIMRWNSRFGITKKLERLLGLHSESVIQDVDIPISRAAEFLQFYAREIGLWPVWICPIGPAPSGGRFTLYPMREDWYVNFGFWDVKRTREPHPAGHFNRMIEEKVVELGGIKSLYSDSYFPRDEFERLYGGDEYRALKAKYDPGNAFPNLYEKVVLKA
jgi:FAD/FMN-containing dehydrogenase